MDAKTALKGPNASAGPFARSITAIARPRVRPTQPFSLTSSSGQYGPWCDQNTKTHPWTSRTGLGHDHAHYRRMYVQQRSLKVVGHRIPCLHVPHNYECLNPSHKNGDRKRCDRIHRSGLPQSLCVLWGNEHRSQQQQPTALTFIAALMFRSQDWGIRCKKLLISSPPVLSCDSRTPSVVVIWPDGLISPIGLISSETFLERYSPSEFPAPMSAV